MNSLKFYKIATYSLLAINLVLLAVMLLAKPCPPFAPKQLATEVMQLDTQQKEQFRANADQHKMQMERIQTAQKQLLCSYFNQLIDNSPVDTTLFFKQYQSLEKEKIEATYTHFQQIKGGLRDNQQAGFQTFIKRALERILLNTPKHPRHPKQ